MAYEQGLSGLTAASNDLNVIGNNIANADTVGYKASVAQFADMYANSVATSVNNQIGIGTMLNTVAQDFSQGTIQTSNSSLNVAINGNGFFQMSNNGVATYSRDGEFKRNAQGYIVNAQGSHLMGYAAGPTGVLNTAQTVPLAAPTTNIAPVATSAITGQFNLNSQDPTNSAAAFSYTTPSTYNYTTSVQAYDSLGGSQDVAMYFVKTAANTWEAYAGVSGSAPSDLGAVTFNTSGQIQATNVSAAAGGAATANLGQFQFTVPNADGSASPQALTLNLSGSTQYGGANGINNLTQDGYASGTLSTFTIGANGMLTGNYSNGQTATLGQIVIANFADPNGLVNMGGNQYSESATSGVPQLSAPGSTNHGVLQGSAVEASNVDLTSELVNLITAQRNYQANAQTIKTQQTVDQTLVNL